jgi:uncharacterized membrane protein
LPLRADLPFWKKKEVYDTLLEDRRIVVSAKATPSTQPELPESLNVVVAGFIHAPYSFTVENAQKYENLKRISSHFEDVRFDSVKNTLFLHMVALGFHAKMTLKLKVVEAIEPARHTEIHWECIEGHFLNMKGVVRFEDYQKRKTEMSFNTDYKAAKLPLPKVLMGLGLEIVAQRVAEQMRAQVEEDYKKPLPKVTSR